MKILEYIRLYIKNSITQIVRLSHALLQLSPIEICIPYICEMFVYKHTETIEYVKK